MAGTKDRVGKEANANVIPQRSHLVHGRTIATRDQCVRAFAEPMATMAQGGVIGLTQLLE